MNSLSDQHRKRLAYIGMILLPIIAGFFYYVHFLMANGYLPSPFLYDKSDTFMDLFTPLYWAYNPGRYTDWGSIYPPLSFFILRFLNFVFAGVEHGTAAAMRDKSPIVIAGFCLIYLAIPAMVLKTKPWRNFITVEKLFIYIAIILSAPMLFALERGNIIILSPIFLALALSRIGFVRSLCIALLINIKPYFALLIIYYIARRNWKGLATCISLSGLIFAVMGLLLDTHFLLFFRNLLSFSQGNGLFSLREVLALPSSISAFSYVLKNPRGAMFASSFLNSADSVIIAYIIEAIKWSALAISVVALFARSSLKHDAEVLLLLVVAITNLGVWVGGYTLILYIALIPVFIKMRAKWVYLGLLSLMAMPIDIIPLIGNSVGVQHSYLTNSYVNVQWTLGLGSVVRPVANFILLLLLSYEFLARKHKVTNESVARYESHFVEKYG